MAGKLPKDDRFEFEVRENGLALAFCLKEEGLVPETELTLPEVLAALKSTEIQSKIDDATLSRVIAERPPGWVEISKGTPPKMPTDGRLEYFVDPFHLNASAKQDEKGKIDYKDLNLFLNVTKGQQLVRKHDPIPGEDGTDIFGKPIPCGKAKEVLLKTGPGVEVIEQGHLAVATEDGAITRKSDTVAITRTYDISGDVSYKTGNIEFNGTVNISGNVLTGFKVIAEDDVVVKGLVEGAEITAGGSIRVGGGIQGGGKAVLTAGENIFAKFAADATLKAEKCVSVENHFLSCHITAGESVTVPHDSGSITGGEVSAGNLIEAAFMGSEISAKTILSIGVNHDLIKVIGSSKDELKDLMRRRDEIEEVLDRINSPQGILVIPAERLESIRVKSIQQKFLLQGGIKHIEEVISHLEEELRIAREGRIIAHDTIYGGAMIRFPGDTLRIDHTLRMATFYYEKGEIRTQAN